MSGVLTRLCLYLHTEACFTNNTMSDISRINKQTLQITNISFALSNRQIILVKTERLPYILKLNPKNRNDKIYNNFNVYSPIISRLPFLTLK